MFSINTPKNQPLCIYGVIRPLYIAARIFGFFPFSVTIKTNGKSRIYFTFFDFVIFSIQVFIYSCFTYVHIFYDIMESSATSPLLAMGMRIGLIFGLMNSVAFLFSDLCNRYRIFDIFNLCQDFDVQVQLLGSTLNNKLNKQCIYIYFVAWAIIASVYAAISFWICKDLYTMKALVITFVGFLLSTNVFGLALSIYAFFLFSVRSRYSSLNVTLRTLLMKRVIVDKSSTKYLIENIMKLADLHDKLNNILDNVNRCYSIQAMLSFAASFTYVVFSLFSVYRGWVMSTVGRQQFYLSIVLSMWSSFYMFFVFTVLWVGHSTKNEGKFTGVLLHRGINKCHNTEIVERLLTFSYQISNRTPDANCNLFSFDWTLLYSIVAGTTTYLIILIQFDASGYEPVSHGLKNISYFEQLK